MGRVVLACVLAAGCNPGPDFVFHDAGPDATDAPPYMPPYCTPAPYDTINCSQALPPLEGTWMSTTSGTTRITFTFSEVAAPCLAATATADWPRPDANGGWYLQTTAATRHFTAGDQVSDISLCVDNGNPSQLRVSGSTRVPGFHTAWETIAYYSMLLVPAPP